MLDGGEADVTPEGGGGWLGDTRRSMKVRAETLSELFAENMDNIDTCIERNTEHRT